MCLSSSTKKLSQSAAAHNSADRHCGGTILAARLTYLIIGHKAPCEDANLLIEWNLVDTAWQVGAVRVDNVLEVLAEANIEWLQINLALNNLEQPVKLIDCQVLNDSL